MPKKPANLIYGVDDKPPFLVGLILGLQHISVIFISVSLPVLVVGYLKEPIDARSAQGFVSLTLLATAAVTILQSLKSRPVGSGYLIPAVCGPAYLSASIMAASAGGLPLLFGMTAFVGMVEIAFSRLMHKLKFLFPTEVTGVIVLMVGVVVIPLAVKSFVGLSPSDTVSTGREVLVGSLTLAVMIALNVYSRGKMRLYSVLIGILFGYFLSGALGIFTRSDFGHLVHAPLFAFPRIRGFGWRFDFAMVIPFAIASLSSTFKTIGDIVTAQKINDAGWRRMDMKSVSGGILADGLGGVIPGLIGGYGQSTSSSNIGLSIATAATSRGIALFIGGILAVLAFMPKLSEFFLLMPLPVLGATMIYAVSFMIVAGLQIIMSRMLDARKIFVVGVSIIAGLSVFVLGDLYGAMHGWLSPIFSSPLSLAAVAAVTLNLVLRIGVKKRASIELAATGKFGDKIFDFMESNGSRWGARREVATRISAALNEFMEIGAASDILADGRAEACVAFDEFSLDVDITYAGRALHAPKTQPSMEEIIGTEKGRLDFAAFMMGKYADRISVSEKDGSVKIMLHFEH